jgi:hypothetical protein
MSKPVLDPSHPPRFPKKLHKKKGSNDEALITGTNISLKDSVDVKGTAGHKPTTWHGTITKDNGDGTYLSEDLKVSHEEEGVIKKDSTENVSTTVTNPSNGTSDPVTTPNAPIIP